ncbi:diguanylate cyclase (GGDEF) domain-containing protein [Mesotoga prima MesG1.Ag.4.2]|uniref:Diguanylate cyclase (GGDEF) domain-containing protein n=2 Tax=Mesotoga prima TaxID=1184387 RepID=I2F8C8_9BACT|nr:transporter substrate-binding domain-containing protein [Mesotoga prima]AFK08181.1 diguanylate cyclase (GGDEF) domain-containing protein [Mesotoga prima MesG1.Ag.4.2]
MKNGKAFLSFFLVLLSTFAFADKLTFGGDSAYPPYEFVDENGEYTGFNVDLMKAVSRVAELDIEIELGEWDLVVEKFKSGELDGLIGMAVTPERQKIYGFSIPHNTLHMAIFYRKGSQEPTVDDLRGREIVVQRNGVMDDYLLENSITDKIVAVESPLDGLKLLSSGTGDFGLFEKYQSLYFAKENEIDNLEVSGATVFERDYAFATAKDDFALLNKLNKGLLLVRESGEYRDIFEKWFGSANWFEQNKRNLLVTAGILVFFVIGLFVLWFWNHTLKVRVKARTEELERKAIENEALRAKIRSLHDIAFKMESCTEEEDVFDLIVKAATEILSFDYYSLDVVEGDYLVVKRHSDNIEVNSRVPKYEGIAGRTLRTGKTIILDDVSKEDDAMPSSSKIKALLSVPIGTIGVFQSVTIESGSFNNEDAELAELLMFHALGALERIKKTREIQFLAFHDSLTGLYNRTFFDEEVSRVDTSRNLPISVIFADVNGLKGLNDRFGHFYGDDYLKTISCTIKESCRHEDLVVRWGGDEFVVLLLRTDTEMAEEIVSRIEKNLSKIDCFAVEASVSFGVATKRDILTDFQDVLRNAELAMYSKKRELRR